MMRCPSLAVQPRARLAAMLLALSTVCSVAHAQNPPVTVTIDAAAGRRAIDPRIYGVNYADAATLADLNSPLNRAGGNSSTRYNWQLNADNRAFDYFFESIGNTSAVPGEYVDTFFSYTKGAGAQSMVAIPMIGWVAKLGPGRTKLSSFSVAKYGAQCRTDPYFPDAGNGKKPDCNTLLTGNDPNDASVLVDSNFQQQWVQHLVGKWGTASAGGVKYYMLDNEPSIWYATHRDVSTTGKTMDEMRALMIEYATKIRDVDPSALIVGPEEWGWPGLIFSGYDQQYGNLHGYGSPLPDRTAHGGQDYLPWLLTQLKQSAVATGKKPIDIFSVHYYPQSGEYGEYEDLSTSMQLLRNRSTRSLWDPNYVDVSWIADKVKLIPRLRAWADTYYFPNTPIALTEYNWGGESHINGATAQADVMGIFGREGLDIANRWTVPAATTPTYKAMKMYRNYDGAKSTFGETSVSTVAPNPDELSAFSALRTADGALTVMVVNKVLSGNTPLTLSLGNFSGNGTAKVYQLTNANVINRLADASYTGTTLTASLPPQSITLYVIAPATSPLTLTRAVSRKLHGGTTNYDLPLTVGTAIGGAVSTEPRETGSGNTIVFQFSAPVTQTGTVSVVDAAAAAVPFTATASGSELRVALSGAVDGKRVTVSSTNVNNAGVNVAVSLGFLVGDVNGNRAVTASDIAAVKGRFGQTVSATNFQYHLSGTGGSISAADVSAVKTRAAKVLP